MPPHHAGTTVRHPALSSAPQAPETLPCAAALDISRALTSLTRSDQELLTLHAWEGLDAPQIAEVLGIAPGTARVRLHRARSRLADALAGTPQTHYGSKATR
ncbi:RNA polymerase sigma factor [Corynebacterium urogenitale]